MIKTSKIFLFREDRYLNRQINFINEKILKELHKIKTKFILFHNKFLINLYFPSNNLKKYRLNSNIYLKYPLLM